MGDWGQLPLDAWLRAEKCTVESSPSGLVGRPDWDVATESRFERVKWKVQSGRRLVFGEGATNENGKTNNGARPNN